MFDPDENFGAPFTELQADQQAEAQMQVLRTRVLNRCFKKHTIDEALNANAYYALQEKRLAFGRANAWAAGGYPV